MYTISESEIFTRKAAAVWTEEERGAFCAFLAENPEAGDVVRGAGGCRKIRWGRAGSGKSGGVRVIYLNRLDRGEIFLLTMYAKADTASIPGHVLKAIKEALENV